MRLSLWSLEYIMEVAKTGSISRAAQNLFLSQPHLSNTIKSVEQELGIVLFHRSAKGMRLTDAGKTFVKSAGAILADVESLESMFQVKPEESVRARISVTRSYQINRCVMEFINRYTDKQQLLLHIKETGPFQVLEDVRTNEAELGILHFFDAQQDYFLNCFKMYSLNYQKQYEREFLLAMSENNPLSVVSHIKSEMLEKQLVVIYGDYENPSASYQTVTDVSGIVMSKKRVYVYDRATAMETLSRCPTSHMWITGLHQDTLKQYGLVLRPCDEVKVRNCGYSITPSDEKLSPAVQELLERMQCIDWSEKIKN